jgi:hypothetical protein
MVDEHRAFLRGPEPKTSTGSLAGTPSRKTAPPTQIFSELQIEALAHLLTEVLKEDIAPLAERVSAIEARPELKHVGTWREGKTFREGNLVTDKGALWLCRKNTLKRPGTAPTNWLLICKAGNAA